MERQNEVAEIPEDGVVDLEQSVILLALIKEDAVESDAVEVEIREVFEMLDVALVAAGQQWLSCQQLGSYSDCK